MKKIIFSIILTMSGLMSQSQVLNSSFEILNSSGTVKNWGISLLTAVIIDSSGGVVADSLVFDNQLYFSTPDANSGTKALEMRNAYHYTSGEQIAGAAILTVNDSSYGDFSAPVTVNSKPLDFTFYYKYFPVGTDTALAWMRVLDAFGAEIGAATIEISGTVGSYTMVSVPIVYSTADSAAAIQIGFTTAKPYTPASYGTRLLIDDVNLVSTGIQSINASDNVISCFPNPAVESLNIKLEGIIPSKNMTIQLTDMFGRIVEKNNFGISGNMVKVDVNSLAQGSYIVTIINDAHHYSARFIK